MGCCQFPVKSDFAAVLSQPVEDRLKQRICRGELGYDRVGQVWGRRVEVKPQPEQLIHETLALCKGLGRIPKYDRASGISAGIEGLG